MLCILSLHTMNGWNNGNGRSREANAEDSISKVVSVFYLAALLCCTKTITTKTTTTTSGKWKMEKAKNGNVDGDDIDGDTSSMKLQFAFIIYFFRRDGVVMEVAVAIIARRWQTTKIALKVRLLTLHTALGARAISAPRIISSNMLFMGKKRRYLKLCVDSLPPSATRTHTHIHQTAIIAMILLTVGCSASYHSEHTHTFIHRPIVGISTFDTFSSFSFPFLFSFSGKRRKSMV